jgi:hypothetical protein
MRDEVKSEILEFMGYVLDRSDIRKSMKKKQLIPNNSHIDEELKNIESEDVKNILLGVKKDRELERVKYLCRNYGGILLKEGLFRKIMGYNPKTT